MTAHRHEEMRRVLVLTPGIAGENGVAAVCRAVLAAFAADPSICIEIGALADTQPWCGSGWAAKQSLAGGSRLRLIRQTLQSACTRACPDLVLILHLHLAPLALPYLLRGARCASFLHGIEAWQPLRRREVAVLARSLLMANSQWTADQFHRANALLAQAPVRITHPGIAAETPAAVSCPWVAGKFALITGRMHPGERYKGHDQLLDLWPRLRQRVPDAQLIIAGGGNDRDRLRARATALGLDDAVRFTGLISDGELAWLYQHCSFFVLPSRGEGFGLVFLEAMRAGKACIGGIGAAAEIIADGQSGRIVDPDDPEALYQALLRMFTNEAEAMEMGHVGRERFLANFTEEQFGLRLRRAFELK